ncbi:nuclear protein 2 [Macaca fascicularis]|uniref:nuclear protein 2 n=1 Tax=Macaca fascicularis TaxID=9541 RepID=UPI0003AB5346|nr:PREDICTED: nuclear transcriptional regulator 1-like protein isoform X1 [Macaca fascicularis]
MSGLPGSTPRKRQPCSRHCTATVTSSKVCLYDAAEGTPASQAEPIGTRGGAAGSSRSAQTRARGHRWPQALGRMAAATERALPRLQALARQPPPISNEEELYDCLDYYYLRDFPASGAGRSKGRTRREQALRTNRPAPGGHERKVMQKLLNGQRKRRQRQLQTWLRTRPT